MKRSGVITKRVLVSPKMAMRLLDVHYALGDKAKQRTLYGLKVVQNTSDMKAGHWDNGSHQGIGIAKNGAILDGLTRLHALIKANVTIEMPVTTNMKPETMDVIDIGRPRSLELILRMSHGVENSQVMASAMRVVLTIGNRRLSNTLSPPQALAMIELMGESVRAVYHTLGIKKPSSYIIGPLSFYATTQRARALEFAEGLRELANLPKHHPVLQLKKFLESHRSRWHEIYNISQACCSAIRRYDQNIVIGDPLELGHAQYEWMIATNPELMQKLLAITK